MNSPELRFQAGAARASLAHAIAAAERAELAAQDDTDLAAEWRRIRIELEAIGRRIQPLHAQASIFRSEVTAPPTPPAA